MLKLIGYALVWVLVASAGCASEGETSFLACGQGQSVEHDNTQYCAYSASLVASIGSSFECPEGTKSRVDLDGAVICSPKSDTQATLPAAVCEVVERVCGGDGGGDDYQNLANFTVFGGDLYVHGIRSPQAAMTAANATFIKKDSVTEPCAKETINDACWFQPSCSGSPAPKTPVTMRPAHVFVTGGTLAKTELPYVGDANASFRLDIMNVRHFNAGDKMTFRVEAGDGVPAMDITSPVLNERTITSPAPNAGALVIAQNADYKVTWQAGPGRVLLTVLQTTTESQTGLGVQSVYCHFDGMTGQGVIPKAALAKLKKSAISFSLNNWTQEQTKLGTAPNRFLVTTLASSTQWSYAGTIQ